MKPTRLYKEVLPNNISVGLRALVWCCDFPANPDPKLVSTSPVVNYDKKTGTFETENSIYQRV